MNRALKLIEDLEQLKQQQQILQTTDEAASKSLNRIYNHMRSDREVGVISSERTHDDQDSGGDGHKLTPQELNQRHAKLKSEIKAAGYSYISSHGEYHGNKERSLLVFGKEPGKDTGLKQFLMKKGEEYGQDSILHKPHDKSSPDLVFTKNRNGSSVGDNFPLGRMRPNRTGKFGSTRLMTGKNAGVRGFAFSDGKEIRVPKPGKLKKSLTTSGLVGDTSVWSNQRQGA